MFPVYFLLFSARRAPGRTFFSKYFSRAFFSMSEKSVEERKENVCLSAVSGNRASPYLGILLE